LILAGLLELFAITFSTFQSQLMVNVPITVCAAQLQARSFLCFISLIKSLNLAGLLEFFAAHHRRPNLKAKSFTRPFAARTASLAGAGAAGEQAADHDGGRSVKLTSRS
jgi:hypothetical protein